MEELRKYRQAVGRRTRDIIQSLEPKVTLSGKKPGNPYSGFLVFCTLQIINLSTLPAQLLAFFITIGLRSPVGSSASGAGNEALLSKPLAIDIISLIRLFWLTTLTPAS